MLMHTRGTPETEAERVRQSFLVSSQKQLNTKKMYSSKLLVDQNERSSFFVLFFFTGSQKTMFDLPLLAPTHTNQLGSSSLA